MIEVRLFHEILVPLLEMTPWNLARKSLRKFSAAQLTSTKILAQRSAVPAVLSRITSSNEPSKRKSPLSPRDKEKLIRIAKRPRKGPFNSILDPAEYGAGSSIVGLSEAVKQSGRYDAWAPEPLQPELEDGLETIQKPVLKVSVLVSFFWTTLISFS